MADEIMIDNEYNVKDLEAQIIPNELEEDEEIQFEIFRNSKKSIILQLKRFLMNQFNFDGSMSNFYLSLILSVIIVGLSTHIFISFHSINLLI